MLDQDLRCIAPRSKKSRDRCPHPSKHGNYCGIHKHMTDNVNNISDTDIHPVIPTVRQVGVLPATVIPTVRQVGVLPATVIPPIHIPIPPIHIPRISSSNKANIYIKNRKIVALTNIISIFNRSIDIANNELFTSKSYTSIEQTSLGLQDYINKLQSIVDDIYKYYNNRLTQIIKLQRWCKRIYSRIISGPAIYHKNRYMCHNREELSSLDPIEDIHSVYFFSYKDSHGHVYGFDMRSIVKITINARNHANIIKIIDKNPYTNEILPINTINRINYKFKWLQSLGIPTQFSTDPLDNESMRQMAVLSLFHRMAELGFSVNHNWFWGLSFKDLQRYYIDMRDLWTYRLQLSHYQKLKIVSAPEKLFDQYKYVNSPSIMNGRLIPPEDIYFHLVDILIPELYKLVSEGETLDDCKTGCIYVLIGLVRVSNEAKKCLPQIAYANGY